MVNESTYIMYHVIQIRILEDPTFWQENQMTLKLGMTYEFGQGQLQETIKYNFFEFMNRNMSQLVTSLKL